MSDWDATPTPPRAAGGVSSHLTRQRHGVAPAACIQARVRKFDGTTCDAFQVWRLVAPWTTGYSVACVVDTYSWQMVRPSASSGHGVGGGLVARQAVGQHLVEAPLLLVST